MKKIKIRFRDTIKPDLCIYDEEGVEVNVVIDPVWVTVTQTSGTKEHINIYPMDLVFSISIEKY